VLKHYIQMRPLRQRNTKTYKVKKFCNHECYWESMRAGNYGRESKIVETCSECNIEFKGKPRGKKRNGEDADNTYCSRDCYDKARARERLKRLGATCSHCSKIYIATSTVKGRNNTFCSQKCRVEFKKPKPVTCKVCRAYFSAISYRINGHIVRTSSRKTCSQKCLSEFYKTDKGRKDKISKAFQGNKHPNWLGGSHYGASRGSGWQKIAEICRDRYKRKCAKCPTTEEESILRGWGRLQVNHIIPFHQWSNKTKANNQSNLEALCKSCHTKTDWKWRKENQVQLTLDIFK